MACTREAHWQAAEGSSKWEKEMGHKGDRLLHLSTKEQLSCSLSNASISVLLSFAEREAGLKPIYVKLLINNREENVLSVKKTFVSQPHCLNLSANRSLSAKASLVWLYQPAASRMGLVHCILTSNKNGCRLLALVKSCFKYS
ncbi:Cytochrome b5 reductase 4 [Platysternon megacephalum]|uniref:Cytochrome b5 reductase 4 n=1 Tax=Platysternon megacephalum TaxID=55544 RepID=A0A4D9EWT8_9SAUR|nr:Cytochrome b5 reductase 4 [Platysternon megacephalum]